MLATTPPSFGAASANPFANSNGYYVQPSFQAQIQSSITGCQGVTECKNLMEMKNTSTGFWVDTKAKIDSLSSALAAAAKVSPPQLFTAVLYNLPNRDCDASNSIGEICCYTKTDGTCDRAKAGDCSAGLKDYSSNFADPIAALFKQYEGKLPLVAIIEPDSLPNLATNLGNPNCANMGTSSAYQNGIPYIIKAIHSAAPSVTMYIDAAHGGWLGWEDNAQAYATLVQSLGVENFVRGFATNVANFQPLGSPCPPEAFDQKMHVWCAGSGKGQACCNDPCGLVAQWSGGNNEYNYVQELTREMKRAMPNFSPFFVIDTSRNGVPNAREDCAAWCNPHKAGSGRVSSSHTLLPMVDATFWIKPPGQSDGCTKAPPLHCTEPTPALSCKHHDKMCDKGVGSQPGEPCAPEAGQWFDFQAKMLATNANFGEAVSSTVITPEATGPFQPCRAHQCTDGYECATVCMPNMATINASQHDSVFATQLAHAAA